MQSLMFVFAGFQSDKSSDGLAILFERLNRTFSEQQMSVSFTRKDKLLTARFEGANFYVSVFNDENELKDWYQMAKDFELTTKPNPIDNNDFEKRLMKKQLQLPMLYKHDHYLVGRTIYTEIERLDLSRVYFFF